MPLKILQENIATRHVKIFSDARIVPWAKDPQIHRDLEEEEEDARSKIGVVPILVT
jgi:hypothetical protein